MVHADHAQRTLETYNVATETYCSAYGSRGPRAVKPGKHRSVYKRLSETLRGSNAATNPAAGASGPASKTVEVALARSETKAGGAAGAEDELPPAPWSPAWFICMYSISLQVFKHIDILHRNREIQFATKRRRRAMNLMQQYMSLFNIVTKQ